MRKSQKQNWNDLLFENRNKAYGAYIIRTEEGITLFKSLGLVVLVLGILVGSLSFIKKDDPIIFELPKPTEHDLVKISEIHLVTPPKVQDKEVKKVQTMKNADSNQMPDPKVKTTIENPINKVQNLGKVDDPEDSPGTDDSPISPAISGNSNQANGNAVVETPKPEETKTVFSPREVSKMVVFPGCEKSKTDKKSLQDCMSKQLADALAMELNDFNEFAFKNGIQNANAKLDFVVDKNGQLTSVKVRGVDESFNSEAKAGLEKIAKRLLNKGKLIQAAELNDGTKVSMSFSLPVQFKQN